MSRKRLVREPKTNEPSGRHALIGDNIKTDTKEYVRKQTKLIYSTRDKEMWSNL
jgi:hypothetical protein